MRQYVTAVLYQLSGAVRGERLRKGESAEGLVLVDSSEGGVPKATFVLEIERRTKNCCLRNDK